MAKPNHIEFEDGTVIPILYEDRAVLALDKPSGWMLAPDSWTKTSRNLQLVLELSMRAGEFWAKARGLRFIRFIHRLDAGTTGIVLFARNRGVLAPYSRLFQEHHIEKRYLAVVQGIPRTDAWSCDLPLAPHRRIAGVVEIDRREGKAAETHFRVLQAGRDSALIEARPVTGRTHQIRVHLAAAGHPVLGDELYRRQFRIPDVAHPGPPKRPLAPEGASGGPGASGTAPQVSAQEPLASTETAAFLLPGEMALRAVLLAYADPFTGRRVRITAPRDAFLRHFGFTPKAAEGSE